MGKLMLVGLLAFAVALTGTAYAEVQNIKVGGDINLKAIIHNNYDLKNKQGNNNGQDKEQPGQAAPNVTNDDNVSFYLSTVRVTIDSDLTDNVSTHVRLLNQRVWDADATGALNDIDIDNAYVVLKEFLYSPLTLKIGRQDLNYGTGFIVGPGLLADPNAVFSSGTTLATGNATAVGAVVTQNPVHGSIGQEYSAYNAYDAIRVILDYAPVTIEGLISKINETGVTNNDQDLYGFLVNYKLDQWNAEVEPYWFYKKNDSAAVLTNDATATNPAGCCVVRSFDINRVHTTGLRLAGSPIENLKLNGEAAYQFGILRDLPDPVNAAAGQNLKRDRRAWGANVDARYTWAHVPWTPMTGAGWIYFSGNSAKSDRSGTQSNTTDDPSDFKAWDPMYRGSFATYIQDFFSGADAPANLYTTFDPNDTAATTNRHLIYGDIGIKPLEDVNLWARYTNVRFAESPRPGRSRYAGDEVDVKASYDYTEDVQLGVWGGWFFPGKYYKQPDSNTRGDALAWTLGGQAAVKF